MYTDVIFTVIEFILFGIGLVIVLAAAWVEND
jgi:hypothetical protein